MSDQKPAEKVELTPEQKEEIKKQKKAKKDAEKLAKEQAKLQAQAKKEEEEKKKREDEKKALTATFDQVKSGERIFGYYPLVQSSLTISSEQSVTGVNFVDVQDVTKKIVDQTVCVRARVHNTRPMGKNTFLVLRHGSHTVQALVFVSEQIPKELSKFSQKIPSESVVEVVGIVKVAEQLVKSCTQEEVELHVTKIFVVSESVPRLPFTIEDAMKAGATDEDDSKEAHVGQDVRLDNRVIDMRAPAHIAIFKIQNAVGMFFRQFLYTKFFTEIHTPKLISTASEGGANVFEVKYFGKFAYLAQSPQLYKQMAVEGDLMKVFEIAPVFRAEKAQTHRHLTEFMGLDLEMEIKHHYNEILDLLDEMFVYIFEQIKEKFKHELEIINQQYPFEPLVYETKKKNLRLTYPEAMQLLREDGLNISDTEDIGTPEEKRLGKIIKKKYNTDFYIIDRFPSALRPFYTMPCPDNDVFSNSYDVFLRGQEIASGAQRIHDADMLVDCATKKGVNLTPIQSYVDAFKYGAWPHGGAGIGLERVTMLFLGINNVRRVSMFPRDPKRLTP